MTRAIETGRALLVGAPTGGLRGVEAALERFASLLESRGISTTAVLAEDASRERVLGALDQIGRELRRDEPFVFYYAGHGHRWVPRDDLLPQVILVLPGTRSSTADDFRGLLGAELKQRLASLTEITRNVTSVIDCCHAEGLIDAVDSSSMSPETIAILQREAGAAIAAKSRRAQQPDGRPDGSLDLIVRVVATSTYERAHGLEHQRDGAGLFTHTLVDVLEDHPDEPWEAVLTRVRARVQARRRTQRPDIHGPWHRVPFTLDEGHSMLQPCVPVPDVWALEGTALLEAQHGDTYRLSLSGSTTVSLDARVIDVEPHRVLLRPESSRALHGQELLWASPHRPHTAYPIGVEPGVCAEELRSVLDTATFDLRPDPADEEVIATVELASEQVELRDCLGDRVAVLPADRSPPELESWLRRLAMFHRCIENIRSDELLEGALTIRWGLEPGSEFPVGTLSPPTVEPGCGIWIELQHHPGPFHALHVAVFRITAERSFQPLTGPSASGIAVRRGSCERIRCDVWAPPSIDADEGHSYHEGIFVVTSTQPLALHGLHVEHESPSASPHGTRGDSRTARTACFMPYRVIP